MLSLSLVSIQTTYNKIHAQLFIYAGVHTLHSEVWGESKASRPKQPNTHNKVIKK